MAIPDTRYGTDANGLICGFLMSPDAHATALDSTAAAEWIASHAQDSGEHFIWLHFNLGHTATEKWLAQHAHLPEEFFDGLREGSHATRIELVEPSLLAIVNDVHYDFSFEPSEISTLWLCVSERVVITARRRPLRSIDKLRTAVKAGEIIRSPLELLIHLLRDQADVLVSIVRGVTTRIDQVEDKLLEGKLGLTRAGLGSLRRLLVRLQRLLAPEPASLFRLLQQPPHWIDEADTMELRQSTEEFSVVLRDMSALQERIKLLQEEIAAHVNEQNNRSLYVLTIVTVLALPINIVAGLLGMNVGGIPLAEHAEGFWIIVALIASFTGIAAWWALKDR
ncbi:transporter [Uliginosibacterium sp. H3]|uniref:Transporter n=1 Tax=Uliginosibacterium silvisoli TaxID=3114758 RepID=A0ABU6JY84_9RHOO|nr:transporter [Uliginosibacterium sp. H3]